MKRVPSLKVVGSSRAPTSTPDSTPVTLIASTHPDLFAPGLQALLGTSVFLFEQGDAALRALHDLAPRVKLFVADFRSLQDGWTGQKFLKYVRDRRELDGVQVWLMADQWQAPQEQWILKCGAAGFIKRQPEHLVPRVQAVSGLPLPVPVGKSRSKNSEGPDSISTVAGDPWMEEVNQVFKRFAGALGAKLLTMQALEAMESQGQGDRHFYVNDLSSRLMNPGRRSEFLVALRQAGLME